MPMMRLRQWAIYPILPLAYYFIAWQGVSMNIIYVLLVSTLFVNIYLIRDLVLVDRIALFNTKKHIIALLYLIGSSIFLVLIPDIVEGYRPELLIGIFAIIWTNDSFAYVSGKLLGKHKLMKRISPKKTIEGFVGGLIMAIVAGIVLHYYLASTGRDNYSVYNWAIIAFVVALFGTIGDLIQSKIKRQAAVKDSGSIMPGHGGIFDRMDSIIFAAPFAYLTFLIINHVS
jgi:phosphatidate cytidylyltransferase